MNRFARLILFCSFCTLLSCDLFQPGVDYDPHNKLVFAAFPDDRSSAHLYITNPDGTGVQEISDQEFFYPVWSPDAQRIAGNFNAGEYQGLRFTEYHGSRPELLPGDDPENPYLILGPATWAPDGQRIAFVACVFGAGYRCVQRGLFVANMETGELMELVVNLEQDAFADPKWSPDGRRILFNYIIKGSSKEKQGIYLVNPDGSELTRLNTGTDAGYGRATWSRNGNNIYYIRGDSTYHYQVWGYDLLSNEKTLIHDGVPTGSRSWQRMLATSPDDSKILAIDGLYRLLLIDIETGALEFLIIEGFSDERRGYINEWVDWSH